MNYLSYVLPVMLYMCIKVSSISPNDREDELEKRSANRPGYVPLEVLAHIENALKNKKEQDEKEALGEVTQGSDVSLDEPAYAKATCTSYPGKVVCQLGRYTFVINNGEHKMDPDVIERFAAMVYHRSQEGDSSFDVSVDIPNNNNLNSDYFGQAQRFPAVESTTAFAENLRSPVFVECSPVIDDRKVSNRHYSPSEIVYSCKKKQFGVGGFQGVEKRMIISVSDEGVVSAGDLVLPYSALMDKRFKRQRGQEIGRAELGGFNVHWTSTTVDNKVYGNECTSQSKSWCPTSVPKCPEQTGDAGCPTAKVVQFASQDPIAGNTAPKVEVVQNAGPAAAPANPTGVGVAQSAVGAASGQNPAAAGEIGTLAKVSGSIKIVSGDPNPAQVGVPQNSGPSAVGSNPNPAPQAAAHVIAGTQIGVPAGLPNVQSDAGSRIAAVQNAGAPLMVTQNAAGQQQVTQYGHARPVQDPGSISADEESGEAAVYAVSKMAPPMVRVFTDICGKETIFPWCPRSISYTECTISGCVTLPECPPNGGKGGLRERREQQLGKKPLCPVSRYRINRMRTSRRLGQRKSYRKRKRQISSLCPTTCPPPPPISCMISCKPETTCTPQTQSITECTTMCMSKREIKRKRKRINHLLWPTGARERYILE